MEQLTLGVSVPDLSHWIVHCGLIHHGDGGHPVLAVTPRPAGQREGGDGAPPRGRRPTVVEVRTWVREAGRGVYEIRNMT